MMEISYWWFVAEFWILCGVIGYSMDVAYWKNRYPNISKEYNAHKSDILFGCIHFYAALTTGWTEHDGMWL